MDPIDLRVRLVGIISALQQSPSMCPHWPVKGSLEINESGSLVLCFARVSAFQVDSVRESSTCIMMTVRELLSSVLGHTLLWLRRPGDGETERESLVVLCPEGIHNAWKEFSVTGDVSNLVAMLMRVPEVPLQEGSWVYYAPACGWIKAW